MNGQRIREVKMSEAHGFRPDPEIRVRDYRIGCIGAGMIMAECHLAAYKEAGFPVVAIASRVAGGTSYHSRWISCSSTNSPSRNP